MSIKNTEQEEIDEIVRKYKERKKKDKIVVTYDENGNRYIHKNGKWIG